ncbi:hypothetical protein LPJ78_004468 [Coemansia sp. RSA 989]|nr:hypothetical protein LPJ68_005549 [Coemansia sp. RSA 1086]KAJ1748756.1 hypothetical protein LPJ79_004254 [Coemansia sp. RSA 1821]KAJ1862788.1 hypothetical protein LPJ78_004468 [Coemansia sp. RSA 989]KAJ1870643.1 hypothetical protein LPJ55_004490 [Coemansia sp. RSA 990]KAJ2668405.1 hypothetical protein IWW42_005231 [Coemansia sp. RSA 1085]
MKIACAAGLALVASQVSAYDIIRASSLNCREKPTTKSDVVKVYSLGDDVEIVCQIEGQKQMGTKVWDKTQDGCYVLDYYLYTGFSYMFKPLCTDSSGSASSSATTEHNSSSSESEDVSENTDSSDTDEMTDSSESNSEELTDDIDSSELGSDESDMEKSDSDSSEPSDTETTSGASILTKGSLLLAIASIATMF